MLRHGRRFRLSNDEARHGNGNENVVRHIPVRQIKESAADKVSDQACLRQACQPMCPAILGPIRSFLCKSAGE